MNTLTHLIRNFKNYLSTSGRGMSTVKSYTSDLNSFAAYIEKQNISYDHVDLSHLKQFTDALSFHKHEQANSVRRKIISIRQFYKFLCGTKILDFNPLESSLIPERKENLPDLLTLKKLNKIFLLAEKHPSPIKRTRDLALLSLLAYEGIKVTELIELEWKDLLLGSRSRSSLSISGPKKRVIELLPETHKNLKKYQRTLATQRDKSYHPKKSHCLFIAFKGPNLSTHLDKITRHGLKFLLYELGKEAGVPKLNTELLRHFAILSLLERFEEAGLVQKHLGLKKPGNILKHLAQIRKTK